MICGVSLNNCIYMKTCKDCKYYSSEFNDVTTARCRRLYSTTDINAVDGKINEKWPHRWCETERSVGWLFARLEGACGLEGRFWKPKL